MPNPTQPMNEEELLLKVRRKAQFFHRGCPADDVIDGDADLEKCTCGVDDQLKDIVKLIIADRNAAIREAREIHVGDKIVLITHTAVNKDAHLFINGYHNPDLCPECIKLGTLSFQSQPNAKEE